MKLATILKKNGLLGVISINSIARKVLGENATAGQIVYLAIKLADNKSGKAPVLPPLSQKEKAAVIKALSEMLGGIAQTISDFEKE